MERKQIRKITLTALFAAMISAGAFIRIPMAPVPITLTTLFTMLGSACLPPSLALSSIIVYIFIGAAGLPVFTSGGGLASLLGPTGGYLIGMIPAAFAGSMLMKAFEAKSYRPAMAQMADGNIITSGNPFRLCPFHYRRHAEGHSDLHHCPRNKKKSDGNALSGVKETPCSRFSQSFSATLLTISQQIHFRKCFR